MRQTVTTTVVVMIISCAGMAMLPTISADCITQTNLNFCSHITYPVFVNTSISSNIAQLDEEAKQAFVSSSGLSFTGCCREVLKRAVCAEMMPRCSSSSQPLPSCRAWTCNAFKERTETEQKITGFQPNRCFESGGVYCTGVTGDVIADYDCTCALGGTQTNKDCTSFNLKVQYPGMNSASEACEENLASPASMPAAPGLLYLGAIMMLMLVLQLV